MTLAHRDRLLAGPEGTARDLEPHGLAIDGDEPERGVAEPERLTDANDLAPTVHESTAAVGLTARADSRDSGITRVGTVGTDGTPDPRT